MGLVADRGIVSYISRISLQRRAETVTLGWTLLATQLSKRDDAGGVKHLLESREGIKMTLIP